MPLPQLWELAKAWYATRLDPAYAGRSLQEAQAIFQWVGLAGEFWEAG